MADKTLHEVLVEIRGDAGDKITDPAVAEKIFRKAVEQLGLPRAMVSLSTRERDLIPRPVLKEILHSGVRHDITPEMKIEAFAKDAENFAKIHTLKELSEMIGVTPGQIKTFMRVHSWGFRKSEGRTYEVRGKN